MKNQKQKKLSLNYFTTETISSISKHRILMLVLVIFMKNFHSDISIVIVNLHLLVYMYRYSTHMRFLPTWLLSYKNSHIYTYIYVYAFRSYTHSPFHLFIAHHIKHFKLYRTSIYTIYVASITYIKIYNM